jgi:hypothetical protein
MLVNEHFMSNCFSLSAMHDIEMDMEKTTAVIGPSIPASIAAAQADVELDPHDW